MSIKEIKAYKTSDGKIFEKTGDALMHETLLSVIVTFQRWSKSMDSAMIAMRKMIRNVNSN